MKHLRRALAPIATRARLAVARAILRAIQDEGSPVRVVQVTALAGETMGRVPHLQHFGFSSAPPAGSRLVLVCPMGSRDNALAVAEEHPDHRPAGLLAEGEVVVYAAGGARVHVRADGSVVVTAPNGVQVSHTLEAGQDLIAGGQVEDLNGTLDALRQAYNVHTHPDPQGGTTGPPVPTA